MRCQAFVWCGVSLQLFIFVWWSLAPYKLIKQAQSLYHLDYITTKVSEQENQLHQHFETENNQSQESTSLNLITSHPLFNISQRRSHLIYVVLGTTQYINHMKAVLQEGGFTELLPYQTWQMDADLVLFWNYSRQIMSEGLL